MAVDTLSKTRQNGYPSLIHLVMDSCGRATCVWREVRYRTLIRACVGLKADIEIARSVF